MDLDPKELAIAALKRGTERVKNTDGTFAYAVGRCDCEGDQDGKRVWFAYDARQIYPIAQAFVAHMLRTHHYNRSAEQPTNETQIRLKFHEYLDNWTSEFVHWRNRGQLVTHVRNLGIASMRYAEKVETFAEETKADDGRGPIEVDWRDVHGFFRAP